MTELQKKPPRGMFRSEAGDHVFARLELDYYKARCALAEEALLKVDVEGDDHSHNIVQAALVVIAASETP